MRFRIHRYVEANREMVAGRITAQTFEFFLARFLILVAIILPFEGIVGSETRTIVRITVSDRRNPP
jgi:hypothetical protein